MDLVRTVNKVSRTAITQPPPVRPAPAA